MPAERAAFFMLEDTNSWVHGELLAQSGHHRLCSDGKLPPSRNLATKKLLKSFCVGVHFLLPTFTYLAKFVVACKKPLYAYNKVTVVLSALTSFGYTHGKFYSQVNTEMSLQACLVCSWQSDLLTVYVYSVQQGKDTNHTEIFNMHLSCPHKLLLLEEIFLLTHWFSFLKTTLKSSLRPFVLWLQNRVSVLAAF